MDEFIDRLNEKYEAVQPLVFKIMEPATFKSSDSEKRFLEKRIDMCEEAIKILEEDVPYSYIKESNTDNERRIFLIKINMLYTTLLECKLEYTLRILKMKKHILGYPVYDN